MKLSNSEIIDVILRELYEKSPKYLIKDIIEPKGIWYSKSKKKFIELIAIIRNSIFINILDNDNALSSDDFKLEISPIGYDFVKKNYSFSIMEDSANRLKRKKLLKKIPKNIFALTSFLGVIWGGTFTYLSYIKSFEIEVQKKEIKKIEKAIEIQRKQSDSLNNVINNLKINYTVETKEDKNKMNKYWR